MHGPLYYTRRWRRVDGVMSPAERVPGRGGALGVRYNQKGGWTVVVRVVVVRAGRGGAAPSALVSCFRLSAPRNALRDSLRSSFTFGQTCPQKRMRAASPKAHATDNARRRRRCKGCCWGCCPFVVADMGPHAASAVSSDEGVVSPLVDQLVRDFALCGTSTDVRTRKDLQS